MNNWSIILRMTGMAEHGSHILNCRYKTVGKTVTYIIHLQKLFGDKLNYYYIDIQKYFKITFSEKQGQDMAKQA